MNLLKHRYVPHARPSIGEDEINAVVQTLRSGWLTSGPMVKSFEAAFSDYLGGNVNSIATNSNTMGLLIAMKALGIGPGDDQHLRRHGYERPPLGREASPRGHRSDHSEH